MKFLCHAGPWSDKYLTSIVNEISQDNTCIILSAHKKVDKTGLIGIYYSNLSKYKTNKLDISEDDRDIIDRCRLLRAIPKEKAILHLYSMREAIRVVLDSVKPDVVLSETIDSYIMDVLYFECKKRDLQFVGLVTVFLNGYFRISSRGEYNLVRTPTDEEILDTLHLLEAKDYLPNFVKKDKDNPSRVILIKWIRNLVKIPYFSVKRFTSGDYYNYHYWQSVIVAKDWAHVFPRFEIGDENWKSVIENTSKKVIYVPLQMIPEATVDYWCDSVDVIDYEKCLLEFISAHVGLHFLIKEHPNVIGYRNPRLYKALSALPNVTVCPTQVNSNSLFDYYAAVLVWTGTVGFESALRGKPVLSFSHPYYFPSETFFKRVFMETTTNEIEHYISQSKAQLSFSEKTELVSHLLSCVSLGVLKVDGSWSSSNINDVANMRQIAKSLKDYLSKTIYPNV